LLAQSVLAQSGFQHWNTENGLSSNWASQIIQDEQGYIWIATQYGLNRFDGYEFETFYYEPNNPNSLLTNWTRSITTDLAGTFWLGTYWGGISAFQPNQHSLTHYPVFAPDSSLVTAIHQVCYTPNAIWAATLNGLYVKNTKENIFNQKSEERVASIQQNRNNDIFCLISDGIQIFDGRTLRELERIPFAENTVKQIFVDHEDTVWAFIKKGLVRLTKENGNWEKKLFAIENTPTNYRYADAPMYEDQQNQIWIGGQNSISIVSPDRKTIRTILLEDFFSDNNFKGEILNFFEDRDHNFWIGTTEGIFLRSPYTKRFEMPMDMSQINQYQELREFVQVDSLFWASNGNKLVVFNLNEPTQLPKTVLERGIFRLLLSKQGELYATGDGIYWINPKNFKVEVLQDQSTNLRSLTEDSKQRIWYSNFKKLVCFDPSENTFQDFDRQNTPSLDYFPSQDLMIDQKDNLWGASLNKGVFYLKNATQFGAQQATFPTFLNFTHELDDVNSLSNRLANNLLEDKEGFIWIGTDAGLNRIDPNNFAVKRYLRKDGLLDEKIMGLLEDDLGYIWGSTVGHGLFRLNPKTEIFEFFDRRDGLISNNFLLSAAYKNKEGWLLFGSENGIQVIDPQQIDKVEKTKISYYFTHLSLGQHTESSADHKIDLHTQYRIELPHDEQSFTVHFTTLNYFQANKTEYRYLLEGLHDTWQSNGNKRSITLTGLSADNYTLKVKAINPNLAFDQEYIALELILLPPWWQYNWAYALYFLLSIAVLYLLYRFQLQQKLKQAEAIRLQELDTLKTRFYTNITHELRTPLTIILGMSEQLKKISKKEIQQKGRLIHRNGQQLLGLINQILDLSKLEAGKLPVHMVHGDLLVYLNYLLESFHSMAAAKNIRLHFLPQIEELWMDYDAEKMKQILSNLLSNALTHTPKDGDIYVQVADEKDQMLLTIRDTGKGIDAQHLPHIFDRFYQIEDSNGGTGVGLALTKELVHLLDGNINVESRQGTTFEIRIPILEKEDTPSAQMQERAVVANNQFFEQKVKTFDLGEDVPLILLVEDNQDVLDFLRDSLKHDYRIQLANNGQFGIESALEHIPDLIISDVMMPEKDGFELCQTLKADQRTSHIPIILLTAKADFDSRIEGLEHGADAYLRKPFEQQELQVRIRKLLELRQTLQKRYQENSFWKEKPNTKEEEFLLQAKSLIEQHLNDSDFGIPQLCQKLGISRSHLHRKLKALTNQSTSIFIRRIRLEKARILLRTTELNVSEVAYQVGFADPAYFSRLYTETFGELPSATHK